MKALVTGAAGFIASHLNQRLLADGFEVRGVDRLSDYYDQELKRRNLAALESQLGFSCIEDDLARGNVDSLLEGVDWVFHLAAQPGVRSSWGRDFETYLSDNLLATQRLLEAAGRRQLRRFVFASSSSVYGDAARIPTAESDSPAPVSPYGITKLAGELLCQQYFNEFGVPTVVLRYFTTFGPRQRPDMAFNRFIGAGLDGEPIAVFGDGLQARDFTYVDDVVDATVAAADRGAPGGIYNIAQGHSITIADVIETIQRLLGRELFVENRPALAGDALRTGADIGRAREELGYRPVIPLKEGLERQIEAERERRTASASYGQGAR